MKGKVTPEVLERLALIRCELQNLIRMASSVPDETFREVSGRWIGELRQMVGTVLPSTVAVLVPTEGSQEMTTLGQARRAEIMVASLLKALAVDPVDLLQKNAQLRQGIEVAFEHMATRFSVAEIASFRQEIQPLLRD